MRAASDVFLRHARADAMRCAQRSVYTNGKSVALCLTEMRRSRARAAGFAIVCMSYGYNHGQDIRTAEPDAVIDSMAELKGLIAPA